MLEAIKAKGLSVDVSWLFHTVLQQKH